MILIKPPLYDNVSFSRVVLDRNNELMRLSLTKDEKYRLYTPLAKISNNFQKAVLLYEDKHFYQHLGVNPKSLLNAFLKTYISGNRKIGGSTITMQLVRLRYKINSSQIYGKIWQIIKALQLELHYTKDEILETYLNLIPYGGNIEGIGAASYIYFNRSALELNLFDSLTLAVIPQNPVKRAPQETNKSQTTIARKYLYSQWVKNNPEDIIYQRLFDLPIKFISTKSLPFTAPHFTLNMLASTTDRTIASTIDSNLQTILERQIKTYIETVSDYGVNNAAALLIDYTNMEVLASIGSANFYNNLIDGQVDGTRAKRSPGSTLKTFIYALAFDQGLIHPLSLLKDSPHQYGNYMPENFDGDFIGPISARESLIKSRNVPVLYLASNLSSPTFYEFLKQAEITKLSKEENYGLSIALGSAEVTMEELVQLYAMLANFGVHQKLKKMLTTKVSMHNKLLSPEASFLTLDILKDIARPGLNYNVYNNSIKIPIYWKTGTSSSYKDSWAVGIFGKYVLAVWVGDFKGRNKGSFIGVKTAAPLFFNMIDAILIRGENKDLIIDQIKKLNLTKVQACTDTGDINNELCPNKIYSWFIPAKSPIKQTGIYRKIIINKKTGKQTCQFIEGQSEYKIISIWPSDLLRLYRRAGIFKNSFSDILTQCNNIIKDSGKLEIVSPLKNVSYSVRRDNKITFSATTDNNAKEIFWFINNELIGKSRPSEPLIWNARVGKVMIHAVDNNGSSDSRQVIIEN